jgi:hypothetical protein
MPGHEALTSGWQGAGCGQGSKAGSPPVTAVRIARSARKSGVAPLQAVSGHVMGGVPGPALFEEVVHNDRLEG